jgi:hypothetical protein
VRILREAEPLERIVDLDRARTARRIDAEPLGEDPVLFRGEEVDARPRGGLVDSLTHFCLLEIGAAAAREPATLPHQRGHRDALV